MMFVVEEFVEMVSREYGETIASKFRERFPVNSKEITFAEALNSLDEILSGGKQIMPTFGRTSPCCAEEGYFSFEHPK